MSELKTIRVYCRRKKGKSKSTGRDYDFLTFEGVTTDGKKVELKFTRACKDVPSEVGVYVIKVPSTAISKDRKSIYEQYWIREITSCESYHKEEVEEEDLPF